MGLAEELRRYIKQARIGHKYLKEGKHLDSQLTELVCTAQEVGLEGVEAILDEHDKEERAMLEDMANYYEQLERARENQE